MQLGQFKRVSLIVCTVFAVNRNRLRGIGPNRNHITIKSQSTINSYKQAKRWQTTILAAFWKSTDLSVEHVKC